MVWYPMQISVNSYYTSWNLHWDKKFKCNLTFSSNTHVPFDTFCHVMVLLICIQLSYKILNHWSSSRRRGRVVESPDLPVVEWRGFESRWKHIFSFEFFRAGQRCQCKWNQAWPFTWSYSCLRPQIRLIIQGLVCFKAVSSVSPCMYQLKSCYLRSSLAVFKAVTCTLCKL